MQEPRSPNASIGLAVFPQWTLIGGLRILHAAVAAPSVIFLATLTVMLFRPPDLHFFHLDRMAFAGLLGCLLLRILVTREPVNSIHWPLLAMVTLTLWTLLQRPYEASLWATFTAQWLVPFAFYHLAQVAFPDATALRHLETFCLLVLGYLCAISVFFIVDARWLIFPRFILDAELGIHADRARGPFLQAVANGVTLNLLGLVALNAFRRGRLQGWRALALLIPLPLAILATQTRSVWLAFCISVLLLPLVSQNRRLRRAGLALTIAGGLAVCGVLSFNDLAETVTARLNERSPVEFRESMLAAGWQMFLERPLLGWEPSSVQSELTRRVSDFRPEASMFHNTYLDIVVSNGAVGLALYLWIFIDLLRLGRSSKLQTGIGGASFLDCEFRALWPALISVYLINAGFVLMQYQFVNALIFTLAGLLAAQNRRGVIPVSSAAKNRTASYA